MNDRESLKIVRGRWDAKVKGDRVRILNAIFHWLSCGDKKNYYNSQSKDIEENNNNKEKEKEKIRDCSRRFKK